MILAILIFLLCMYFTDQNFPDIHRSDIYGHNILKMKVKKLRFGRNVTKNI